MLQLVVSRNSTSMNHMSKFPGKTLSVGMATNHGHRYLYIEVPVHWRATLKLFCAKTNLPPMFKRNKFEELRSICKNIRSELEKWRHLEDRYFINSIIQKYNKFQHLYFIDFIKYFKHIALASFYIFKKN